MLRGIFECQLLAGRSILQISYPRGRSSRRSVERVLEATVGRDVEWRDAPLRVGGLCVRYSWEEEEEEGVSETLVDQRGLCGCVKRGSRKATSQSVITLRLR